MTSHVPAFIKEAYSNDKELHATSNGLLHFSVHNAGEINLPEGVLVAMDPLVTVQTRPFSERVGKGRFPVLLSVARLEKSGEQRLAFAMVRFREEPVIQWQLATFVGDDADQLREDEYIGYGVDSGTGSFMSGATAELLAGASDRLQKRFSAQIQKAMQDTYIDTWSWANIDLDETDNNNVVAFSSGWGDGVYPSYFGYGESARLCCLVTDFQLVSQPDEEGSSPGQAKKWWQFWK